MNQPTVTRSECEALLKPFTVGELQEFFDVKRLARAHLELLLEVEELRSQKAALESHVQSLHDWKSPDGVLRVKDLDWFKGLFK